MGESNSRVNGGGGELWPWGRWEMVRNMDVGGGGKGSVEEEGRWCSVPAAAAGRLHAGDTRPRQGEAAVAREGAAAVAAVGLLP